MAEFPQKILNYFTPQAAERLRQEIADAGGAEVFAVGRLGRDDLIHDVEVFARGTAREVPVVDLAAFEGDVVIHNHPSGRLTPSEPDVHIAASFSRSGVGFLIVNNDVSDLAVVKKVMVSAGGIRVEPGAVRAVFAEDGPLAASLPKFEPRPQQLDMALKVCEAFNSNTHLIVEAGTGTGKSLAYLVPAIMWAVKNKKRVVVSTATINLQEQLVEKDLPALARAMRMNFTWALVKGRGNYLCKRKFGDVFRFADQTLDAAELDVFAQVAAWAGETETGSRSEMGFAVPQDLWEKVASDADTCPRAKCPFAGSCFVNAVRRKAQSATVLVVNHHLLFSDIAVRQALGFATEASVLPAYSKVVFDEAHHVADAVSEHLGRTVSRLALTKLANALYRRDSRRLRRAARIAAEPEEKDGGMEDGLSRGVLAKAREMLIPKGSGLSTRSRTEIRKRIDGLVEAATSLREASEALFAAVASFVRSAKGGDASGTSVRLTKETCTGPLWEAGVLPTADRVCTLLRTISQGLSDLGKAIEAGGVDMDSPDMVGLMAELAAYVLRAEGTRCDLDFMLALDDERMVFWAEVSGGAADGLDLGPASLPGSVSVRLTATPLDIATEMEEAVLANLDTAVFTSATLAVDGSFEYMKNEMGLSNLGEKLMELKVGSPFDFKKNVVLAVPTELPPPDSRGFSEAAAKTLLEVLEVTRGRAFVLFTSYALMNWMAKALRDELAARGMTVFVQGELPRSLIIDRFKTARAPVLFGTDSFWEGVDVPGEALSCVILTRLPFSVPDDPVFQARCEKIQAKGRNPFMHYAVPQAAIKFKQGFGRLIRTSEDRGAVVVLDKRIVEKPYGRVFLNSLPGYTLATGDDKTILDAIQTVLN